MASAFDGNGSIYINHTNNKGAEKLEFSSPYGLRNQDVCCNHIESRYDQIILMIVIHSLHPYQSVISWKQRAAWMFLNPFWGNNRCKEMLVEVFDASVEMRFLSFSSLFWDTLWVFDAWWWLDVDVISWILSSPVAILSLIGNIALPV